MTRSPRLPGVPTTAAVGTRAAKVISTVAAVLAIVALAIELTVSHGWADLFWFLFAALLLVSSYALQHYARAVTIYRDRDETSRTAGEPSPP